LIVQSMLFYTGLEVARPCMYWMGSIKVYDGAPG